MTTTLAPYVLGVDERGHITRLYHYSVEAYLEEDGMWFSNSACGKRLRVLTGRETAPDDQEMCAACWRARL